MNRSEIISTALSISDRADDTVVVAAIDGLLSIVDARIKKNLVSYQKEYRVQIVTSADKEYYGLPSDFNGIVDIELRDADSSRSRSTLTMMTPEQMNSYSSLSNAGYYYSILAGQLQIMPPAPDGYVLEVVYDRNLTPLSSTNPTNWLSDFSPDTYVFGLLVEISSLVKDKESAVSWETRFVTSLEELNANEDRVKWSGPPLRCQIDTPIP